MAVCVCQERPEYWRSSKVHSEGHVELVDSRNSINMRSSKPGEVRLYLENAENIQDNWCLGLSCYTSRLRLCSCPGS